MKLPIRYIATLISLLLLGSAGRFAHAQGSDCSKVPDYNKLKAALTQVVKEGKDANGGMGNQEWAALVNRDGTVCAVAYSGPDRSKQWPGSRLIAAEKANTANALSLDDFALSTGNLYSGAQPGGSLYGLAMLGPNPTAAFAGPPSKIGQTDDPMVGKPIGGVIVFGGGLALYTKEGKLVGGLGVSGDTSCTDHIIAWKVRHALNLDNVPGGVSPTHDDNIVFDITEDSHGHPVSANGWGHPQCDTAG